MAEKVLVTYASKYGATKEIAEKVGEVLDRAGFQVDLVPAGSVQDLSRYQAVVFGSAVYVGNWPKEASAFIKTNETALAHQPVWLFVSGPTGEGDPAALVEGKILPSALQGAIDRIQPRDITVFGGFIDPNKVNPIEKWAIKSLVKKPFGDFRDWNAVANWANGIVDTMKETEPS